MEIEADEGLHSPILSVPANAVSASSVVRPQLNSKTRVRKLECLVALHECGQVCVNDAVPALDWVVSR